MVPANANNRPVAIGTAGCAGESRNSPLTMWAPWLSRPMCRLMSSSIRSFASELRRRTNGSADSSSVAPNRVIELTTSTAFSRAPTSWAHEPSRRPRATVRRVGLTASVVGHVVDRDAQRQHQRFVLARLDVDPVGVAHSEPALRDSCDEVAVALDLVLVVDEVAFRVEVAAVLHVDVE